MSELIVLTFESLDDAREVMRVLRTVEKDGALQLDDTAIIEKDEHGKIHAKNELDTGVETGMVVGGMIGVILAFMFPIAGLALGIAGGALVGRMVDLGVDRDLVKDVTNDLKPGSSALFLMVRGGYPSVVLGALKDHKGSVYQTSLSPDVENELRHALGEKTTPSY